MEYAILILSAVAVVLLTVVVVLLLKNKNAPAGGNNVDALRAIESLRAELKAEANSIKENAVAEQRHAVELLGNGLAIHKDSVDKALFNTDRRLDEFTKAVDAKLDKIRDGVIKSVEEVRENNATQLEKMRMTVDEKLTATLDQRFKQSFSIVAETLDSITKSFGEMKGLTEDVTDLKKVLTNVKTRGTWGEVSLENLLTQLLIPEQYQRNFKIDKKNGDEIVDFVIVMPGKDEKAYLPVDAKFPVEDYQRIVDAKDAATAEAAKKALANRIKGEAASISSKYIRPPKTTDFAVMYLPTEGLFAEVLQIAGLAEEIQNKYRVVICSPTTLAAFLNCLQMGFKTVAIEKRSSEIWKLLAQFKKDFTTFSDLLVRTEKQISTISNTIKDANKRTELIRSRLKNVETEGIESGDDGLLDDVAADALLDEGVDDED